METVPGPGQGEAAASQDYQDHVREERGEVGDLPAGLDPLDEAEGHHAPGRG